MKETQKNVRDYLAAIGKRGGSHQLARTDQIARGDLIWIHVRTPGSTRGSRVGLGASPKRTLIYLRS